MGVTRFLINEQPSPIIGKADYEFFYSGTLQILDDIKIPAKIKIIDVQINRLDVYVRTPSTGADIKVTFYRNGVSLGQVDCVAGTNLATLSIALTTIFAGDVMTITIDQIGQTVFGVTLSAWARVAS